MMGEPIYTSARCPTAHKADLKEKDYVISVSQLCYFLKIQEVVETISTRQWYMPVIPALWRLGMGGLEAPYQDSQKRREEGEQIAA